MSDNFYELQPETIKAFNDVFNSKSFPVKIDIQFFGNKKQKQMIKIAKIADDFEYLIEKQLKVTINEDLFDQFDELSKTILFEQNIDKVMVDGNTGKISIKPLALITSPALISKYGVDEITRANQLQSLTVEQTADAKSEYII
jgi:hypothetical protein